MSGLPDDFNGFTTPGDRTYYDRKESSNDTQAQRCSYKAFLSWWCAPEQQELRYSCAEGWGWIVWQAARSKLEGA